MANGSDRAAPCPAIAIIAVNPRPTGQSNKIAGYPILLPTFLFFFSTTRNESKEEEEENSTGQLFPSWWWSRLAAAAGSGGISSSSGRKKEPTLRHLLPSAVGVAGDRRTAAGSVSGSGSIILALMAPLGLAGASSYHELCCYGAGIAGNIFAFVLFVSPLPTFRRIVRNGSTEQFSAMPYIYSLLNCLICVWYALPFVSYGVVLLATVNTIGAAFQLAYTAVFIAYADAKKRLKVSMLLLGVFCAFGLIVYVSMAIFDHKPRQTFVGYLSVASLICMFASPLSIINLVIKTKSVEYMPFYLSLSMSLMSASFFAYGALLDDFFIYIPNGIGTVLGVIQLLLYAYFRKGSGDEARRPLLVTHT